MPKRIKTQNRAVRWKTFSQINVQLKKGKSRRGRKSSGVKKRDLLFETPFTRKRDMQAKMRKK